MKRNNMSKRVREALKRLDYWEENPERFFKAMEKQRHGNGVVNFTNYPNLGLLARPGDKQKICFGLPWQAYRELDPDHGLGLLHTVLEETPFAYPVSPETRKRVRAIIRQKVHEKYWFVLERSLDEIADRAADSEERDSLEDVILCSVWAHIETEHFSLAWLAAMARHAYWIEENEYAFGYLIALLDQKLSNESHFLRGRKSVESASQGGIARASMFHSVTEKTIGEMARLIDGGQSIARAAELAHGNGFGSSASANRKLWSRHRKK